MNCLKARPLWIICLLPQRHGYYTLTIISRNLQIHFQTRIVCIPGETRVYVNCIWGLKHNTTPLVVNWTYFCSLQSFWAKCTPGGGRKSFYSDCFYISNKTQTAAYFHSLKYGGWEVFNEKLVLLTIKSELIAPKKLICVNF